MSQQIGTAFKKQFSDNVRLLSQQKSSRLINTVTITDIEGDEAFFDYVGKTELVERESRHGDTPLVETPHIRRAIKTKWFDWADLIDKADMKKLSADMTSPYVQTASSAAGRKIDSLIISAVNAVAYTGEKGTVAANYDTDMTVGVQVGGSATDVGLNVEKLLEAQEIVDSFDPDEMDERFIIFNAKQRRQLLNNTEVKSADYNTVKALVKGQIDEFVGFKFIRSEQVLKDANGHDILPYYLKSGMGLALEKAPEIDVGPRRDKNNSTQIHLCMGMDAARLEESKAGLITCMR